VSRRSGLGRGLGALIPAEAVGEHASVLREVPIASIRPNSYQPRAHFEEESMSSLSASIRELGVLQPLLVRRVQSDGLEAEDAEELYELIAGERRWRGARRAGLQTVPVLVQDADDVQSLEKALVENLHREDLNALEEAAAYQQLIEEFSFTHDEVATRVGKSRTTITNTIRLLQLPAGVQRALADGDLTAGHARALLGTPDRAFQDQLTKLIVAEGLNVRATEEAVRIRNQESAGGSQADGDVDLLEDAAPIGTTLSSTGASRAPRLPEPGVLELEDLLSAHLDTRVKVDVGGRRGRLVVDFATIEDLERIYRLMIGDRSSL